MEMLLKLLVSIAPSAGAIAGVAVVLYAIRRFLDRQERRLSGKRYRDQFIMLVLTLMGLLVIVVVLPLGDTLRGQLLSFGGILLSAALALSSTTFLGNALAGVMHRAVPNFRVGDFIRVGEHFGRVTERGLLFTEIQTEDRDLTLRPNLYVVTNPVVVIRSSGTIIAATVSLGYDVPHCDVEKSLVEAAQAAELSEPFVHIRELADHAVTYRVAGLLTEVKQLISARSRLHTAVLDCLHHHGIEIVSPSFMNTRAVQPDKLFIPTSPAPSESCQQAASSLTPEEIAFDKADQAESLELLRRQYAKLGADIDATAASARDAADEAETARHETRLRQMKAAQEWLASIITSREAAATSPPDGGSPTKSA